MIEVSSSVQVFWNFRERESFQARVKFFFFFFFSAVSLHFLLSLKNHTTNYQQEVTYSSIQQALPNLHVLLFKVASCMFRFTHGP